jgi:hypothetical protein
MKRLVIVAVLVSGFVVLWSGLARQAPANAMAPVRIGVFDSRAVAIAYWRSEAGMQQLRGLREEYEKAKVANDDKRVKELEQEGPWQQVRMHQQAFSTATVASILEKVSDKLPAVARDAGVSAIVSKWEVPYKDASIETVDVTVPLVRLFNTDEATLRMIDDMKTIAPVPFEKLPLDPKM